MKYTFTPKLNKKNMVQSFALKYTFSPLSRGVRGVFDIICHAELVSASNEPEIPKQVRNDKKSEMRGAAHVDKQPGEFLRANRCYLQEFQYIYPGGRVW